MPSVRLITALTGLVLLFSTTACGSEFIRAEDLYPDETEFKIDEDAHILDTLESREVLSVIAEYRRALVRKDWGTLNRLISDDYYDNAGTTDTTADDYGRAELREIFEMMAKHAQTIQYTVLVKDVVVNGRQAHIDFEYEYAYQYRIADEVTWDAGLEINRLRLVRENDSWKIISGL